MKYYPRLKLYKATNVKFDLINMEAYSYRWWRFVARIDGKIIFNNFRYSNSTIKHQWKVRALLSNLGINIDIEMPLVRGIRHDQTLAEMIIESEEILCNEYLDQEIKKQDRYARAKFRKQTKVLEDYLENEVHFRDYEIKPKSDFGKYNKIAVHQCVDSKSLQDDVSNAIYNFHRDGFGNIVFYVGDAK